MCRLVGPALLIYSIVLLRATSQAVTLDEADSFNNFANENAFYPSSSNHVLNSLLTRSATQVFGISQFTLRLPSLLGAALYLLAVSSLVNRITIPRRRYLAFAIFTLNPFVLDYLIAARGYALALGFLSAIVALAMRLIEDPPPVRQELVECAILSVCGALSIAANFSFAFVILSSIPAFLIISVCVRPRLSHWLAVCAATSLPGLAVGYALLGETIRAYPRNQLYYGASTWTEMWTEMLDAVYPSQNLSSRLINLEPILTSLRHAAGYLVLVLIMIAIWGALATKSWSARFVWLALGLTICAHAIAHSQGLPLPMDRTSLFIVFLLTIVLLYGDAAVRSPAARLASTAAICVTLLSFVLSFRTNYFRIWDFDLDTDRGFRSVEEYAKTHALHSAGCTWRYAGAYNFYRRASHTESLVPTCNFVNQENPEPREVYLVISPFQDEFIAKAKLEVIYRGPVSGLIVGVRAPKQ